MGFVGTMLQVRLRGVKKHRSRTMPTWPPSDVRMRRGGRAKHPASLDPQGDGAEVQQASAVPSIDDLWKGQEID
ncbi:MAG: hypothetical protein DI596_11285 [Azospira oryzae]|nr:MAG: hypothetical protein DI596_11285 [Azospira oryzae]PZP78016.1 MAG: hypothetical protein DI593_11285 [Azospira oryzae]